MPCGLNNRVSFSLPLLLNEIRYCLFSEDHHGCFAILQPTSERSAPLPTSIIQEKKWYGRLQVKSGSNSESPTEISDRNWLESLTLRINSCLTAGFLDQGSLLPVILDRFLLSYRVSVRATLDLSSKSKIAGMKFPLKYANRPKARNYACHADEQGFPKSSPTS
jgi:hypothetical protein